jgi:hypothetical protein
MSNLSTGEYLRKWCSMAIGTAFKRLGPVNLVVGIALGFISWKWPTLGGLGTTLRWLLPVAAFFAFAVWHTFLAPLELIREVEQQLSDAIARAATAEAQLRETRDCQRIADFLTEQHHYGVHQLLHQPPATLEALPQWSGWVNNWNVAVFAKMRELKCSPQELNHVETISSTEVNAVLPDPYQEPDGAPKDFSDRFVQRWARSNAEAARQLEFPIQMHAIRLSRVADISTKYALRAEDIRLATTKRLLAP